MEKIFIKNPLHHHHAHHIDWNETRMLLNEKDSVIRKQQDKIENLEIKFNLLKRKYDNLVSLLKQQVGDDDQTETNNNKPIAIDTVTLESLRSQHEQIDAQLIINNSNSSSSNDDYYEDDDIDYNENDKPINNNDKKKNVNNKNKNDLLSIDVINTNNTDDDDNDVVLGNNNNKNNTNIDNIIDAYDSNIREDIISLLNTSKIIQTNEYESLRLIDELDLKYAATANNVGYQHKRVENAATRIQTAYRQFKLKKNYFKIYENSIKRRSLDIEKLHSLNYSLSESSSDSCCNKLLTPSTSSSSSPSTSSNVPIALKEEEQHQSDAVKNSIERLASNATSTDLPSINFENSIENYQENKTNDLLLLSSSSLVSQTNLDHIDAATVSDKPQKNIELSVAEELIKEQLNSNAQSLSQEQAPQQQKLLCTTQSNSCSSVHSVYSNTTISSKCSYLSSGSSISAVSSNAVAAQPDNIEMIKLSPAITSPQATAVAAATTASTTPPVPQPGIKTTPKLAKAVNLASYERKLMVGTSLFNHKPDRGIRYLVENSYIDHTPRSIAKFLLSNKLLSKQMIADYISNNQDPFSRSVLDEFCQLINFSGLPVDEALRLFQSNFRMTGDAQKIEYLTHTFSRHYIEANKVECKRVFKCAEETIDILAYAIILLNTTIHNPNVKPNERTKFEQFVQMTRNIDDGQDINREYLQSLYDRVKQKEFKPDPDHVNDVFELEKQFVNAKKPAVSLALPHRRLVCSVKLFEIYDLTKKEKLTTHQRDVFLFNDLLVVTKIFTKKKSNTLYTFRCCFQLGSMHVYQFKTDHYQYGIRLLRLPEKKVLITFNARNKNDQDLFCHDLMESIRETNEVEFHMNNESIKTISKTAIGNKIDSVDDNTTTTTQQVQQTTITEKIVISDEIHASPSRFVDRVASTMKRTFSNSLLNLSSPSSNNNNNSYLNSDQSLLKAHQRTVSQSSLNTIKSNLATNNPKMLLASNEKINKIKLTQINEKIIFNVKQSTSNYHLSSECLVNGNEKIFRSTRTQSLLHRNSDNKTDDDDVFEQEQQPKQSKRHKNENEKLERQYSFINSSKTKSSTSSSSTNYKYFTLSANAGRSIDKSIRNMFKYIGLYNNPKNNS